MVKSEKRSFSDGFFSSLTSHFKAPTNSDREKFDVAAITQDSRNQQLFNELRSGSVQARAKAAESLSMILYDFSPSVVPDIWYCASDLISPNAQASVRRSALKLLSACVDLQYEDPAPYYIYFNDALSNCHFTKDKVDSELSLFLQILKKLTDDGSFVHHFQEPFKGPLVDFFIDALTPNEISKNPNLPELLMFIIGSIKSGILTYEESSKTAVTNLITLVVKLSLKTSDKMILERCIEVIDSLVVYENIPKELYYDTLEILCGSSILNLHYYDLATSVITHLIEKAQFQPIYSALIDIARCTKSRGEKNTNASIGSIKILGFLFSKFAFQMPIEPVLETFQVIIEWKKSALTSAMSQFFIEILQDDIVLSQFNQSNWDSDELSILTVLKSISTKISQPDEIESYKLILVQLQNLAEEAKYPGSLPKLINFFIINSNHLSAKNSVFVLKYFSMENLCSPINSNWRDNLELVLNTFYRDTSKDLPIRLAAIKLFKGVFDSTLRTFKDREEIQLELIDRVFKNLKSEDSTDVLKELADCLIELSDNVSESVYESTLNLYIAPGFYGGSHRRSSLAGLGSTSEESVLFSTKASKIILKAFVTIFAVTLTTNGAKAALTYQFLIRVSQDALEKKDVDKLLITSRLLVRIRESSGKRVYLTNPTDMEGLSAAFSRNLNVRNSQETKTSANTLDEKWTFPEDISYIPEKYLDIPSSLVTIGDGLLSSLSLSPTIQIDQWLSLVIQILESCPHWEVYSFIYAHFCPQLSNIKLFESCGESIRKFRTLVCDQLSLKLPPKLKIPDNITKHDLQVAIVRNFTPLISYHEMFSKQDEDQIINALLVGLSSWEKTAIPCIHILTVCCYEIPLSVKKYLSLILTKLQTRISSAFASAHILEFLLSLSYIPSLTSNFTVDEFKRAFGITFKLIQYSHDISDRKENSHIGILSHGEELEAENAPSTESLEITPTISTYLLTLSYDVIANWFLNMKLKDRRKLSSFITKNLILSQSNRGSDIDKQNLAFIDLISRFTYSNQALKFSPIDVQSFAEDAPILSSKWIYGNGIISIQTHAETGESIIAIRRASGSSVFRVIPDESMIPYYTNQLHSADDEDLFTENYMLLQLIVHLDPESSTKPIPIPDESSFSRSISNFDRIPVVEFHKIGILYVGPNKVTESDILSSISGSPEYEKFLSNFGRLIELKGCKSFYVGGLDTENDTDGPYAYGWNDKISQLIFHTTTMMPNGDENDKYSSKKRHIGNNYVNIFFDESGHSSFDFNTIKSQFNFLNIVIQRHSLSFAGEESTEDNIKKYKVKILRRSGVPALFATCHFKIVSEENLATFVRTLALIADQFAQIWHSNGNYSSNWSHRMRQILQIKEKAVKFHEELKNKDVDESKNESKGTVGQSFLEQLSSGSGDGNLARSGSLSRPKNTNNYEFFDSDDNEIFKNLEFTSFTK